jgi:hypothetical protein
MHSRLKSVSLLELVNASAGINQLLLARKERVTVAANIYFESFAIFRRTRFEGSTARASYRNFVIVRMDFRFHLFSPRYSFSYLLLSNYNAFFFLRQLFLTQFIKKYLQIS